jgi:2-amino-4-hydroxy-6-hydroxymethyldihydropteridine diphosphokinase
MILIALGSNLSSAAGSPLATCRAALAALPSRGVQVLKISRWYETTPVPASDQPNFVNGVAAVATERSPAGLLDALHAIEREFARERSMVNAARTLDLDLLDYHGRMQAEGAPLLPHPRLHARAFVLVPLHDVAPEWRHPRLAQTPSELLAGVGIDPKNPGIRPIPDAP